MVAARNFPLIQNSNIDSQEMGKRSQKEEKMNTGLISPSGPFIGSEQSQERFIFLAGSYHVTVTDTSLVF